MARTPGRAIVTILGPDGTGASGRNVRVDGRRATPCGSGCYTTPASDHPAVRIQVGGASTTIRAPVDAPDATAQLARITRAVRASKSIVFDETLSSNPHNATTTRFTAVAPNRLSYVTRGGPSAIVIGSRRWDRERPGAPYVESSQTPLDVIQPYWQTPTNVHEIAPGVLTFLDRRIPAWFRLELGPTAAAAAADDRGRALHDRPLRRFRRACDGIAAALAVALRLLADDLEEARRVLERREPGRRVARPPRAPRRTTDGRDRAGGADEAADCKRAELACAARDFHATILLVRLTTFGDLLLDVIVQLEQPLVPGDDQVAVTRTGAGGQAANVAAWARALGAEARYVGRRGDDAAGEIVAQELRAHGVELVGASSVDAPESSSASRRPVTARWRRIAARRSS